jgi:hypothetical protein
MDGWIDELQVGMLEKSFLSSFLLIIVFFFGFYLFIYLFLKNYLFWDWENEDLGDGPKVFVYW